MQDLINERFVPVRVHVREQKDEYQRLATRYGAQWTPTILLVDPEGVERHRIEGFLPVDDFMSQLSLGAAHAAFKRNDYELSERFFQETADRFPKTDAAPEAVYWAGVSKYRRTNDGGALGETAAALKERYPQSSWATKGSVWGA